VLTGVLADQAALYGVLAELEALGLELIEVRRLPPRRPRQGPSPGYDWPLPLAMTGHFGGFERALQAKR
jgi:hypothetical protein